MTGWEQNDEETSGEMEGIGSVCGEIKMGLGWVKKGGVGRELGVSWEGWGEGVGGGEVKGGGRKEGDEVKREEGL